MTPDAYRVADALRVRLELVRIVFVVAATRTEIGMAAAVHKQRRAVGHRDERRIALSNVEEVNAQTTVRRARAQRVQGHQGILDDEPIGILEEPFQISDQFAQPQFADYFHSRRPDPPAGVGQAER